MLQPTVTNGVGTPEGVTTVDDNPELVGTSGMVTVTSTVEVCLKPSGNVRVRTEVTSLPNGSRDVTVAVGSETAGIVTVTVATDTNAGESSEVAAGTAESAVVELTAGRVTVTVVNKSVDSATVTAVTAVL